MNCLHTINQSATQHQTVITQITALGTNDAVIFLEDGVYNAIASGPASQLIHESSARGVRFYAIETDLKARGCAAIVHASIELIHYEKFVELSTTHSNICSWF